MKRIELALFGMLLLLFTTLDLEAQVAVSGREAEQVADSAAGKNYITAAPRQRPVITLDKEEAIRYLQSRYKSGDWSNPSDPLRLALGQLIYFASHPPFDTVKKYLTGYSYDSLNIPWDRFYRWDSVRMRIPVIIPPRFTPPADSIARLDTIGMGHQRDTVSLAISGIERDSISMYKPVLPEPTVKLRDTVLFVAVDTLPEVLPYRSSQPFWIYRHPYQGDSLAAAVGILVRHLTDRDSTILSFRGVYGPSVPVWLNSRSDRMIRYWLRNEFDDSVTVWIGNAGRDTIGIYLEEGIMFRRPVKQTTISDARLDLKDVNSARLQDVNKIFVKPQYWKLRSEAAFVLNQTYLTNWVKGGESSISTAMDLTGFADYNNKQAKLLSSNFIRLKYGLVKSGDTKIRKNLDLLETNSKLSHKAFGKFDFSATLLFKTQVSKGYNYLKDTTILVSKFMSPGTLTIGLGLDYKPNKTTSINFAPFTYKGTFVMDTVNIDRSKYGVPAGRKSMHEPGVSLLVSNEYKPFKSLTITNRVQLFTNYINKPQNIDIDWEMIATAKLNWFTDVRVNTHLIFDDDTRTTVYDKDQNPVPGPDGKPKKTARIQFRELIGFSFVFRF